MTNLFSKIEKKKKFNVGFNSNSLIKNCIKVSIVAVSMSAIVACGGGGGGGSKGNSGSNNGQPAINVNVNNANNNANNNVNSNTNTMLVTGLTLSIAPNMLSNLQGFINLASSTITIAGTNERANIQTTPAGVMVLTFDNLKNIYAGQNVTLEINDGMHTASAVVSTTKEGSGTTGTTGLTTGGTNSGTTSGNNGNGNNGGNDNNGNGQTNGQGTNGQGANGHGTNVHSGEQEIDFKVEGGIDPQTGKPTVTTKPLTCQVDTIETPENPRHNVGSNGDGQGSQNIGNGLGTNGGPTITGKDGLTYDACVEPDAPGVGSGTGISGLVACDKRPLVTHFSFNAGLVNLTGMNVTNMKYYIVNHGSTPSASFNQTSKEIEFIFDNVVGVHEGDNVSVEFNDGYVNGTTRVAAKNGHLNETDLRYDFVPSGLRIITPGGYACTLATGVTVVNVSCSDAATNALVDDPNKVAWTHHDIVIKSLSTKISIADAKTGIVNPATTTYCMLAKQQASNQIIPLSVPVRMNQNMFDANAETKDFIKFVPARGCESAFEYQIKQGNEKVYCTDDGESYATTKNITDNVSVVDTNMADVIAKQTNITTVFNKYDGIASPCQSQSVIFY